MLPQATYNWLVVLAVLRYSCIHDRIEWTKTRLDCSLTLSSSILIIVLDSNKHVKHSWISARFNYRIPGCKRSSVNENSTLWYRQCFLKRNFFFRHDLKNSRNPICQGKLGVSHKLFDGKTGRRPECSLNNIWLRVHKCRFAFSLPCQSM